MVMIHQRHRQTDDKR